MANLDDLPEIIGHVLKAAIYQKFKHYYFCANAETREQQQYNAQSIQQASPAPKRFDGIDDELKIPECIHMREVFERKNLKPLLKQAVDLHYCKETEAKRADIFRIAKKITFSEKAYALINACIEKNDQELQEEEKQRRISALLTKHGGT